MGAMYHYIVQGEQLGIKNVALMPNHTPEGKALLTKAGFGQDTFNLGEGLATADAQTTGNTETRSLIHRMP